MDLSPLPAVKSSKRLCAGWDESDMSTWPWWSAGNQFLWGEGGAVCLLHYNRERHPHIIYHDYSSAGLDQDWVLPQEEHSLLGFLGYGADDVMPRSLKDTTAATLVLFLKSIAIYTVLRQLQAVVAAPGR